MSVPAPLRDPAALLPHGAAACLVDRVLELEEEAIRCSGRFPAASPFVRTGRAPSFVLLELAAQAAALLEAAEALRAGAPPRPGIGFLVRVRSMRCEVADVAAGEPVETRVRRVGAAPPLFLYEAEVRVGGRTAWRGSFGTFAEAAVPSAPGEAGAP